MLKCFVPKVESNACLLLLSHQIGNTRSVCGMEIPPTYDQEDDDEENFKIDDDEEDKDVVADEQTQDVVPFVGNGNGQFSFSFGQEKYVRDKEDYKKIQKYLFDAYRVRIMARKGKPQEKNTDGTNGTDGRPYKVEILYVKTFFIVCYKLIAQILKMIG